MAEKKSTKKTAPAKKVKFTTESLRSMKPAEQIKLLAEKQAELQEAKRSLAARELTNPRRVTHLRKEIAVIKTVNKETASKESK